MLGKIGFLASEDSGGTTRQGATIEAFADAAWAADENGTRMVFSTNDADNSLSTVLTLDSDKLATFAGAVTVTGALSGTLATATQANIDSIGTAGDTLNILSNRLTMINSANFYPVHDLISTYQAATGPAIVMRNQRTNGGGTILDGTLTSGLELDGNTDADGEIDVTIGAGANSVVTIPGQLLAVNGGMGARHYGNIIKILPQDFMKNDDSSGNALNYKDGATAGVQVDNNSLETICFVAIPEGMKATHVDMYGSANFGVIVHEESISSNVAWSGGSAATDLAGGSGVCNTQIDLSADVISTETNMLAIKVTVTAVSHRVWGGLVTIAAQ